MEYESCCHDCGKKRYGDKQLQGCITIHLDICPFCKKKKGIIPAVDWAGYGD